MNSNYGTTAAYRVLRALRSAHTFRQQHDGQDAIGAGGWVPGWYLLRPEIGGTEGLRRLRELRAAGEPIEGPKRFGKAATRYYRIAE
jgi:hypothetical protein